MDFHETANIPGTIRQVSASLKIDIGVRSSELTRRLLLNISQLTRYKGAKFIMIPGICTDKQVKIS
jgi:hypothetical protein